MPMEKFRFYITRKDGKKMVLSAENNDPNILFFLKTFIWSLPIISPIILLISLIYVINYYQLFGINILDYIHISDILIKSVRVIILSIVSYMPFLFIGLRDARGMQEYVAIKINGHKVRFSLGFIVRKALGILTALIIYTFVVLMVFNDITAEFMSITYASSVTAHYMTAYICGEFKTFFSIRTHIIITAVFACLISSFILSSREHALILEQNGTKFIALRDGIMLNPKSDTTFIGMTSDFIFLFNVKNNASLIYPKSSLIYLQSSDKPIFNLPAKIDSLHYIINHRFHFQ